MNIHKTRIVCAMLLIALGMTEITHAAVVYGQPVGLTNLTGSRSVGNGLATTIANWNDGELQWHITDNGNNTFTYRYILRNLNQPAVSHMTIDLTDEAIQGETVADNPGLVIGVTVRNLDSNGDTLGSIITVPDGDIEFGSGELEGITGAVKIDQGDPENWDDTQHPPAVEYAFTSNRAPVWGHLIAEVGQGGNTLTNSGFANDAGENQLLYVARPNGLPTTEVPEPASLALFGLGGLLMIKRRR